MAISSQSPSCSTFTCASIFASQLRLATDFSFLFASHWPARLATGPTNAVHITHSPCCWCPAQASSDADVWHFFFYIDCHLSSELGIVCLLHRGRKCLATRHWGPWGQPSRIIRSEKHYLLNCVWENDCVNGVFRSPWHQPILQPLALKILSWLRLVLAGSCLHSCCSLTQQLFWYSCRFQPLF